MSKRIIAIDPGEMTGWAIGRIGEIPFITRDEAVVEDHPLIASGAEPYEYRNALVVEQWGHDPWKVFLINMANVMEGDSPFDIVVYESFRIRAEAAKALTGSDVPTAQCIGGIKLLSWRCGAKLCTSEPSNKPVIDRQMRGTEYLPKRDGVEHERDACRHIFWYAVNKAKLDPSECRLG